MSSDEIRKVAEEVGLIAESLAMFKILSLAYQISQQLPDTHLLITGEPGTGKGLVAEFIHKVTLGRSGKELVESPTTETDTTRISGIIGGQFFQDNSGHFSFHPGIFEKAEQGTLLFNHLHLMPQEFQSALLPVVASKTRCLTNNRGKSILLDVRIISTADDGMETRVKNGEFIEELFLHLSRHTIPIPPLRERRKDILPLARYLLKELEPGLDLDFGPKAIKFFTNEENDWKQNGYDIERHLTRLLTDRPADTNLLDETIEDISAGLQDEAQEPRDLTKYSKNQQEQLVLSILQKYNGNVSAAAQHFGIQRSKFYRDYKSIIELFRSRKPKTPPPDSTNQTELTN